jgi:hypothetical protein
VSARFLLDSNAHREPLRPAPNGGFLTRFEQHRHCMAIAAPAWHEARFGLYGPGSSGRVGRSRSPTE